MLYLVALQLAKAKKPSGGRDREVLGCILQLGTEDLFSRAALVEICFIL